MIDLFHIFRTVHQPLPSHIGITHPEFWGIIRPAWGVRVRLSASGLIYLIFFFSFSYFFFLYV